jgi:hypothetical protein
MRLRPSQTGYARPAERFSFVEPAISQHNYSRELISLSASGGKCAPHVQAALDRAQELSDNFEGTGPEIARDLESKSI